MQGKAIRGSTLMYNILANDKRKEGKKDFSLTKTIKKVNKEQKQSVFIKNYYMADSFFKFWPFNINIQYYTDIEGQNFYLY